MDQISTHKLEQMTRTARQSAVGDLDRRTIVQVGDIVNRAQRNETMIAPRFELFHFVMSICSQKSRTALIEAGLDFASSELVIMPPANENYDAAYVALRMTSEAARSRPLVGSYSGATSVESEGFDPLVVPTLVDFESNDIVTDSFDIALRANDASRGALIPSEFKDAVMLEMRAVDALPHAGLFYGANPDGDHRPAPIQTGMKDAHIRKIEQVERRLDGLAQNDPLREAYLHKIIKEKAGRTWIAEPANMVRMIRNTQDGITAFGARLRTHNSQWATGDQFTLADIFWSVSLFRLLYLGYDWMWADDPGIAAYAERGFARPSVQAGAIDWPGHPPGDAITKFQRST